MVNRLHCHSFRKMVAWLGETICIALLSGASSSWRTPSSDTVKRQVIYIKQGFDNVCRKRTPLCLGMTFVQKIYARSDVSQTIFIQMTSPQVLQASENEERRLINWFYQKRNVEVTYQQNI